LRLQPVPPPKRVAFELSIQTAGQRFPAGGELFFLGDSLLLARLQAFMGLEVARLRLTRDSLQIWDRFNGRVILLGSQADRLPLGLALPEGVRLTPSQIWTWLSGRDLPALWSDTTLLHQEPGAWRWRSAEVQFDFDPEIGLPAGLQRYRNDTLQEERRYEDWMRWENVWLPRRILIRRPAEGLEILYRLRTLDTTGTPPAWDPPGQLPRLRW
jgi:hypothetical protein